MNRLDWDFSGQKILWFLLLVLVLIGLLIAVVWADSEVTFQDENLEAAIREVTNKPTGPLFQSDLNKITHLDASRRSIESLGGIEHLVSLVVLDLSRNRVNDVTPLGALHHLTELDLSRNYIADLGGVNFDSLANAQIKILNLEGNQISDITLLQSLGNIRELNLNRNRVVDISPLENLALLVELSLRENDIGKIEPLSGLHDLEYLNIHSNANISSALPLGSLTGLETLIMENVVLGDDIQLLSAMEHLTDLNIANSQVSDISPLRNLTRLRELKLAGNDVADISPLAGLVNLTYLNLHSNSRIESILPLENLTNLQTLILTNVPIGDSINILSEMSDLNYLNIRNCGVSDIEVLGQLMRGGALQDHKNRNIRAAVDVRDNPISLEASDGYQPVRPYWDNIDSRIPFVLPNYTTLNPPVFSQLGGYYEEPFELQLTTDESGAEIYYSLDGSEPTKDDLLYTAPIQIQSRRGEAAELAWIEAMSPRWAPPGGEIFLVTPVRAKVFETDGNASSPTITHTFLVDEEKRYTIPVISLTTNPEYLFDYDHGIYVMGRAFDELYDPNPDLNVWERIANYKFRGEEWERPVHIEYFETNGSLGFSQDAIVRIQGTATRERAQKSLRIVAHDVDGVNELIEYPLFPGLTNPFYGNPVESFKAIILRNGGSDWESAILRDALIQSLVSHTYLNTQAERPVVVFLNGEYWGLYNLRERADEFSIASYYHLDPNDVVILSNDGDLNAGEPGDEQPYLDLFAFVRDNDMADEDNYAYVQTQMDTENYIDYQVVEIYSGNVNWPNVNIKFWRKDIDAYDPDAPYGHDGRWRWILYDTDSGFGADSKVEYDNLLNATQARWPGILLSSLLENPEFRVSFINRFADHLNTSFVPSRVIATINQMEAAREQEIEEALLRWRGDDASIEQWRGVMGVLREYGEERPFFVRRHIVDYFDLSGTAKVNLFADAERGYIVLNSIAIVDGTPGVETPSAWSGIYFQDVPITLTAIAEPGYRFLRWEGEGLQGINPAMDTITISLTEDVSLTAIFQPIE